MLAFYFKLFPLIAVIIGFIPFKSMAEQPLVVPAPQEAPIQKENLSVKKQNGEEVNFEVDVAQTGVQLAKGLMFVSEMPENHGMLFIFEGEAERSFWMKNTLIPLDMIFIKRNGIIHHIHHNAQPHDLTSVTSKGPVHAVLEINGGLSEKHGLKPGDSVFHPAFSMVMVK